MKRHLSLIALAALLPSAAFAATDGTLGDTSTGSLTFTLTINEPAPQIRISGLEDIVLNTTVGSIPTNSSNNVCVFMTTPGTFRADITATPLEINGTAVDYSVFFTGPSVDSPSVNAIVSNTTRELSATGFSPSLVQDCTTGPFPAIFVTGLPEAPTETGTGTATITLTVTPD